MFESDDFDQILSQLDLPDPSETPISLSNTPSLRAATQKDSLCKTNLLINNCMKLTDSIKENTSENNIVKRLNITHSYVNDKKNETSPKHNKRKLINSYFNHKNKRKFPGPAGLLNGTFEDSKEVDDICHVELLSQDIDYSQIHLHKHIFESPLWARLLQDTVDIKVDSVKNIKHHALKQNLRHQKAETITAYIVSVDRSGIDPLIVLRDTTDDIKCTLHRDAWVAFSPYIVSECCALVLRNATVLTTGSAFKKHYLNITLSNIQSVYSSAIIRQEDESFPTGFSKVYEEDYTIIKNEKQSTGVNINPIQFEDENLLDGLDGAFSDDVFS